MKNLKEIFTADIKKGWQGYEISLQLNGAMSKDCKIIKHESDSLTEIKKHASGLTSAYKNALLDDEIDLIYLQAYAAGKLIYGRKIEKHNIHW